MKARSLFAVALAAMLVPAVVSAAPKAAARAQPRSATEGLSVGGFLGYETDDLGGIALRVDGELPFRALTPQINLSWVGSIGYSRLSDDETVFGTKFETTANVLKFIPAARFSFALNPEFTLFGDAGLGLYYAGVSSEVGGTEVFDDSEFSLMMRIGGGAWYQLNPQTRIGAAIEFDPYFGDTFDQSTFIIQGGVMFRL